MRSETILTSQIPTTTSKFTMIKNKRKVPQTSCLTSLLPTPSCMQVRNTEQFLQSNHCDMPNMPCHAVSCRKLRELPLFFVWKHYYRLPFLPLLAISVARKEEKSWLVMLSFVCERVRDKKAGKRMKKMGKKRGKIHKIERKIKGKWGKTKLKWRDLGQN